MPYLCVHMQVGREYNLSNYSASGPHVPRSFAMPISAIYYPITLDSVDVRDAAVQIYLTCLCVSREG